MHTATYCSTVHVVTATYCSTVHAVTATYCSTVHVVTGYSGSLSRNGATITLHGYV